MHSIVRFVGVTALDCDLFHHACLGCLISTEMSYYVCVHLQILVMNGFACWLREFKYSCT